MYDYVTRPSLHSQHNYHTTYWSYALESRRQKFVNPLGIVPNVSLRRKSASRSNTESRADASAPALMMTAFFRPQEHVLVLVARRSFGGTLATRIELTIHAVVVEK